MTRALGAAKLTLAVFVAAILQVTIVYSLDVAGGAPNLLLVTLVAIALLHGAVAGAAAGFFGGLVVDTATLDTLGLSSLLLTLAGYWTGRYGETTARDRGHAPLLAVFAITVLYAVATLTLLFVLGTEVSPRVALVDSLIPGVVLNLLLATPIYALCRRFLRPAAHGAREVRLLG